MDDPENLHSGELVKKSSPPKVPIRCKTLGSLFSASAHDLRAFDIEQEKNDEDSPRGILEACKKNAESELDSPLKGPTFCIPKKPHFRWKNLFKAWKKKSIMKRLTSIPPVQKITSKINRVGENTGDVSPVDANICKMKASWKIFSFSELQKATNNFSSENMIGKGGFAEVYKGCLKDGELVAIKRLTRGTNEERISSFLSELGIIAHVDHPNTAKLIGYGVQGGLHIVLQLSSLGSLGNLLHGSGEQIDWSIRYKIAVGTADGLLYLHEGCQRRIIHRDIKADNILLTENYDPQICDFGLGKWLPSECTHHNVVKFEGTFGYFAPEYFMHGIVDEKTDIYAFGVLLLELISGRKAFNSEQQSILLWAKPLLDAHDLEKLVDPVLGDDYDDEELDRMVLTAALCVQQTPVLRPRMNQVVILLRGDDYCPDSAKTKQVHALRRTYSVELQDAKEYNSTRRLNELRRLREVAFGH
ncbi:receptor-like cytosolic serine/threonine-protein kinase RBK2 [Silene latifolia]|uniref:receptor-like cytosolic serine/threonine-protein kinase RBK2 n=1 Tax=Silene latifolia TaxID=37657 RepID=UPI003D76FA5F